MAVNVSFSVVFGFTTQKIVVLLQKEKKAGYTLQCGTAG